MVVYFPSKKATETKSKQSQNFIVFIIKVWSSELDHLALSLFISSQLKMLASLNSQHSLRSAVGLNAFQPQHNLLCSFSLFPENWFSLPTIATLLPVITPLSLGIQWILALLVLCHFVGLVLAALLTESPAGFRNVHLKNKPFRTCSSDNWHNALLDPDEAKAFHENSTQTPR